MLLDFHIWHYTDLLLGAFVSTFSPPPRNSAAYGDHGEAACSQMCTTTNNCAVFFFLPFRTFSFCSKTIKTCNWKSNEIHTGILTIFSFHHLSYSHSFLLLLAVLFSLGDPISTVLQYREVMMRNGVIMPVVKPQAAQQMCFRDLHLSLNGLVLCSGNPIFNLTLVSAGNPVFLMVTNILSFSAPYVFNHCCSWATAHF